MHILIDRHFTYITQRERFNLYIHKELGNKLYIEHVDSLQNPVITLADFVAGAIRIAHTKRNFLFRECMKDLFVEERMVIWKEIKKR